MLNAPLLSPDGAGHQFTQNVAWHVLNVLGQTYGHALPTMQNAAAEAVEKLFEQLPIGGQSGVKDELRARRLRAKENAQRLARRGFKRGGDEGTRTPDPLHANKKQPAKSRTKNAAKFPENHEP